MIITVCGSMTNYGLMVSVREELTGMGHVVVLPEPADCKHLEKIEKGNYIDNFKLKIRYNYIRRHYGNIVSGDCVLIANFDKNGTKNYIGANTFLEMGFAFAHGKPIYLINPIPENEFYYHEIKAMAPIILRGNLKRLPNKIVLLSKS